MLLLGGFFYSIPALKSNESIKMEEDQPMMIFFVKENLCPVSFNIAIFTP